MPESAIPRARIVAAHQASYRRGGDDAPLNLLTEAIVATCRAGGIDPNDLDGLAVSSFGLAPDNAVTLAEQLGLSLRWAWQGVHGGASGVVSVIEAAHAIALGRADAVICAAGDAFSVESHNALLDSFNKAMTCYLGPYGYGGANGLFALVEREHRELYGTTREQLGKIAVTQRASAQRNPNALFKGKGLSLQQYLNARLIADPVRLFDCVMPCTGADAVLLLSEARANSLNLPGVRVLAGDQRHNFLPEEVLSLTTGAAAYGDRLFAAANVGRSELDFVQLYDDYPIMVLIQLEDLGFAEKGKGGAFVSQADLTLGGDLPLNTGGGQLSCGQAGASGGMLGVYEGVTQLLGMAGERQLPQAHVGLVSGFGMVGYGKGLSSATVILERVGQTVREARS